MKMMAICAVVTALLAGAPQGRGAVFTVQDSIEMRTFSDPYQGNASATAKFSPDGRHFVVVASRGVLAANQVESTLYLYSAAAVREFLQGSKEALAGKPLATLSAVPDTRPSNTYASVITGVRWSSDSQAVLFLGQNASAERQLYRVSIDDGVSQPITPAGYDVNDFSTAGDTIVYTASNTGENRETVYRRNLGVPINASARTVTGVPLASILLPSAEVPPPESLELGVIQRGHARILTDPGSPGSKRALDPYFSVLSLAPSGRKLVVLLPVTRVPESWSSYRTTSPAFQKAYPIHPRDADRNSNVTHVLQPRAYAVLDLDSGAATPLVNAPFSYSFGYVDARMAVWAQDEQKILVTGTFLPLAGSLTRQEEARRQQPCSAAVVDAHSLAASCVAFNGYKRDAEDNDDAKRILLHAEFGADAKEVRLEFLTSNTTGAQVFERYQLLEGEWKLMETVREAAATKRAPGSEALSVRIKQGLDEPPTLWVSSAETGRGNELWNPNPQLATRHLGAASVYRWKDETGHEWTGGLVRPVGYRRGQRYPLVIQTYTFDDRQFLADGMATTAEAAMPLAGSGIAVLQTQRRSDHAMTNQEASIQLAGFAAAIDQLTSEGVVDPARVGIIGFSRGCYYVESALIGMPGRFAAATIADGVDKSYMQHWMFETTARDDLAIYGVGPVGEGLKTWLKAAPGFNLDKAHTPVRIEAIGVSSILSEWELYASLREQGKPVDLIYFPAGQHILKKPLERLASQQGNVDWFRFWLQGYEDPDLSKVDQYKRWESLCDMQSAQNPDRPAFCIPSRH